MEDIPNGKGQDGRLPRTQEVQSRFNLLDEISRGALYRGGSDADDFIRGYGTGFWLGVLFLAVLFIIGSLTA